jgi:hypothetical protein
MPSVEPARLTHSFRFAAHDSAKSRLRLGKRPIAVALAAGVPGELIHDGWLSFQNRKLFRVKGERSEDPTPAPLLSKMADEERHRMPAPWQPHSPIGPYETWEGAHPQHGYVARPVQKLT